VVAAETPRRQTLGFPPFGGLAEVKGAVDAVAAACAAVADAGVTVLGPDAEGTSALLRAPSFAVLCDALAAPAVDAARTKGRLRIDVDPRRV
jgi:primosomal protein N'